MPRRYLPPGRLGEHAEPELAPTGTPAAVRTDERVAGRLTELLITKGADRGNGNGRTVPPTSVARLQRLAGNRAVADRLGGGGRTIQRSRNRTSDEEEPGPAPTAQAGPVETSSEPPGVTEEAAGLDALVEEKVSPIVGEGGRVLPGAEIEGEAGAGAAAGPNTRKGGSSALSEAPGAAGAGDLGTATPGIEAPATPTPEAGGWGEQVPSEGGASPAPELPESESLPANEQAQIGMLNAAGSEATSSAAQAGAGADKLAEVAVSTTGVAYVSALQTITSQAVQWRTRILGVAPKVVNKVGAKLATVRSKASRTIRNAAGKVTSVADAAKGVLAGARQALGTARSAARGIAGRLRSALGGVGEAILKFLSSLVSPARDALDRLLKTGAKILLDGIARVRAAAASAVAFVKKEVGARLDAAILRVVDMVRAVVKSGLEQAQQAKSLIDGSVKAARAQFRLMVLVGSTLFASARQQANAGTAAALARVTAAGTAGAGQVKTRRGRKVFRQAARMWQSMVRGLRGSARSRLAAGLATIKALKGAGEAAIGSARAEANANYGAARASLVNLEMTAVNETTELSKSVSDAGAKATEAADTAVTEAEKLIREVAGEGEGDASKLQGLINRSGK